MKTQISRDGYRRDKRYSGVYQQQGRLITDSDWNELVDTFKARVDDALVDVIGTGSPKTGAAAIQMAGTTPKIVPGTVYAGGLEARVVAAPGVSTPFDFSQQVDFPSAPPLPSAGTAYRIYVDVWDRPVGPLEDDGLRDPALHGADTCTRTQVTAQIKWCPATKNPENTVDNPAQGDARLTLKFPAGGSQAGADPCDPQAQEVDPVGGDFLFRVEVHDARWQAGVTPNAPDRVIVKWSRENGAEQYAFTDVPDWFKTGPWIYELFDTDAEKHLGFHLATTNWTPKRGSLVTALPQTAPAGTMVRRWDGYSVLMRSGNTWSVSAANGEKTADTAGGATVQIAGGAVTVALTDLEFTLELLSKILLPGDFWSAPVRRATYQAGKELLKNAIPSGIVHRYVLLAEVLTTNQLRPRTAQEQRKLAFPRLSELDAGDMGYSTTCTSGLYDATHDTVKKALDRLCAINGSHVGYTKPDDKSVYKGNNPATVKQALDLLADVQSDDIGYSTTCTSGLFDNTHDNVKKALDRLCAINGTHVGFAPSANTSIYQGVNPTTVAQALNLLTDVKSQQISYTPASNPNNVHEVKAALDELYARPVNNGSRVYIGQNGQYASIDLAVNALVGQGKTDIALALLPGDHTLSTGWNQLDFTNVHLNILGLGRAARLRVTYANGYFYFDRFASVCFQSVHLILGDNTQMTFNQCREVVLLDNTLEGSRLSNKPLIYLDQARRVVIRGNLIDSQWETIDSSMGTILGLGAYENTPDMFNGGLTEFRTRARALGVILFNLQASVRNPLGQGIKSRQAAVTSLTTDERTAYNAIGDLLLDPGYQPGYLDSYVDTFVELVNSLRYLLYVKNPGTSIQYSIFLGPTLIQGNQIRGLLGYVQLPKASVSLTSLRNQFLSWVQSGRFSFSNLRSTMQVIGNVMAGIRFGETLTNYIRNAITTNAFFSFSGPFRTLDVTDNIIENEDNCFCADEVNLQGNQFTFPAYSEGIAAFVLSSNATYFNNRSRSGAFLYNGVPVPNNNSMESGNFRLGIISYFIS
jgi:hypothetical protein